MDQIKIINIIAESLGIKKSELLPEISLYEDLNCSRLEINDLMIKICQELQIDYQNTEFGQIETVNDILQFCEDNSDEI